MKQDVEIVEREEKIIIPIICQDGYIPNSNNSWYNKY